MVSRRTNFGERSEPAPGRGGKLSNQRGGGGGTKYRFATGWDTHTLVWLTDLKLLGYSYSRRTNKFETARTLVLS